MAVLKVKPKTVGVGPRAGKMTVKPKSGGMVSDVRRKAQIATVPTPRSIKGPSPGIKGSPPKALPKNRGPNTSVGPTTQGGAGNKGVIGPNKKMPTQKLVNRKPKGQTSRINPKIGY
jgi:hypothetical protein